MVYSATDRTGYGATGASNATDALVNKASDFASVAGQKIESAVDEAGTVARNAAAQARDAGERVQAVAGNVKTAVDKSVRDQPMATLAVAAAMGFVLGALWKS